MAVDDALVTEAASAFEATIIRALEDGGQKAVRLVKVDGLEFVLKVIQVGATSPESLQRASREVDLLLAIDSEHVVRAASDLVLLRDPPVGAAWLEELLDGDDLSDRVGAAPNNKSATPRPPGSPTCHRTHSRSTLSGSSSPWSLTTCSHGVAP